jgi:phospholipid transport system transporter-binding protein
MRRGSDKVEIVNVSPGRYAIRGALTFLTAKRASESAERTLEDPAATSIEVDCAAVSESDSAGLAVLVNWLALAQRLGRGLRFLNLPAEIHALARISDIDEIVAAGSLEE